jgi:hypothetical protein
MQTIIDLPFGEKLAVLVAISVVLSVVILFLLSTGSVLRLYVSAEQLWRMQFLFRDPVRLAEQAPQVSTQIHRYEVVSVSDGPTGVYKFTTWLIAAYNPDEAVALARRGQREKLAMGAANFRIHGCRKLRDVHA